MTKKEKIKIHREMTIEDIFASFPEKAQRLSQEMANVGLQCVGCQAATWETLEAGMLGHGMNEATINELIQHLNEIVEKEIDPQTICMTKRAAKKFKEILEKKGKKGWGLRFADKPGGCGGYEYLLDFSEKPKENDVVFSSYGIDIHVNHKMLSRLLGSEIDYLDGLNGSGFKVSNPNVKSSCGCGQSQSY